MVTKLAMLVLFWHDRLLTTNSCCPADCLRHLLALKVERSKGETCSPYGSIVCNMQLQQATFKWHSECGSLTTPTPSRPALRSFHNAAKAANELTTQPSQPRPCKDRSIALKSQRTCLLLHYCCAGLVAARAQQRNTCSICRQI